MKGKLEASRVINNLVKKINVKKEWWITIPYDNLSFNSNIKYDPQMKTPITNIKVDEDIAIKYTTLPKVSG